MSEDRDYSEYIDPEITEYEGFSTGDQIVVIADDEDKGVYEGDEGQIIGFEVVPPAKDPAMAMAFGNDPKGRTAIMVVIDGTDEPIEIRPHQMEVQ